MRTDERLRKLAENWRDTAKKLSAEEQIRSLSGPIGPEAYYGRGERWAYRACVEELLALLNEAAPAPQEAAGENTTQRAYREWSAHMDSLANERMDATCDTPQEAEPLRGQNEQAWDDLRADGGLPESHVEPCGTSKAPEGWWCSRVKGHGGPCAAYSVEPPRPDVRAELEAVVREMQDRAWQDFNFSQRAHDLTKEWAKAIAALAARLGEQ